MQWGHGPMHKEQERKGAKTGCQRGAKGRPRGPDAKSKRPLEQEQGRIKVGAIDAAALGPFLK